MIYLQHFGLREPPFGITPDTSFFYACTSIQQALNTLVVAVDNGENPRGIERGTAVLTGPRTTQPKIAIRVSIEESPVVSLRLMNQ